jgi:transposase-like protein
MTVSRETYSDEIKAQALAALLTGQSFTQVARIFSVPVGTLKSWKNRHEDALLSQPDASGATTKRERIGQLLIEYVEESLTTLREQQRIFRDEAWLKQQSASEVAVLHGVTTDKVIRLLEGLADNAGPDDLS